MTGFRVTQRMLVDTSLSSLQLGLSRLADVQEQVSTGRVLNRPSDSPADTVSAMRLRASLAAREQYVRNAEDGLSRLGVADQALQGVLTQVSHARDLVLRGASGAISPGGRAALAQELEQLRAGLVDEANSTFLTRPVFGGITSGAVAYDEDGTFVGTAGEISRRVADGVRIRVDVEGTAVFGDGDTSVFAEIDAAAAALRAGDEDGIRAALTTLAARHEQVAGVLTDVGARYARIERAVASAEDEQVDLTSSLSDVENADLPRVLIDLKMQEMAYQTALAATARVMQPSLLDFLR